MEKPYFHAINIIKTGPISAWVYKLHRRGLELPLFMPIITHLEYKVRD